MLKKLIERLENPRGTAFVINDKPYSYEVLGQLTKQYCHYLLQLEKPFIGIAMHDDIYTYAFIIASVLSKCGYVILNLANPTERNNIIAHQAGLTEVVSSVAHDLSQVPAFLAFTAMESIPLTPEGLSFTEPDPNSPAYVLFTSGSTGKPKGVMITKRNLSALLASVTNIPIPISEQDKVLQMFDLTFDGSVLMLFLPLCAGATIYTTNPDKLKYLDIARILVSYSPTFVFLVPSVISLLQPFMASLHLPSVTTFIVGAEAASKATLDIIIPSIPNATIWNLYGPTEATVCVLAYKLDDNVNKELYHGIIPIGKPMPGVKVLVMDEAKEVTECNVQGELYIGGEQLCLGYINDEVRNRTEFIIQNVNGCEDRYYATGDIVYRNEFGNYMYCSRKDRQIKIQGNRIELTEIEFHARHITHGEVVAMAKESNGVTRIYLFVQNYPGKAETIAKHLESLLPAYMIPHKIINIKQFPILDSNKIDWKALYESIQ